uniref:Uncharacterized protein n=1 Tax=Anguilla anguilla TaxID=7936 RepID=A0A0E9UN02_ANGAN
MQFLYPSHPDLPLLLLTSSASFLMAP